MRGSGTAQLSRWYYNSATRTCDAFTYGGLGGGQNMFLSKEDCESVGCPSAFEAFGVYS